MLVTHAADTPKRRCVLDFVGPDQAGERLMMRCHQYCGSAADFVHRQSSRYPGFCNGDGGSFCEELCVCVLEACDVRLVIATILKEIAG